MSYIHQKELPELRKKYSGKKIVFCSGSFDLIHAGHALFFEDCKKHGDILIVMVAADHVLKKNKGDGRPVMNQHVRLKMIDSLKPVDYCFLDKVSPKDEEPLACLDVIIGELKPDVYVINEDASNIPYRENMVKKHGTKLVILPRTAPKEFEEISTTKLIEKIRNLR